ncbi:MAG: hypothetical protein J2P36_30690, partial [Ktedonobacteraceae bacterium]|nr:hypothetical protein [Ktedonobacteraceae bacterium]
YAWLSVSIETDDQAYLKRLKGGPQLKKRWELVHAASVAGVRAQITVSPCLSYSNPEAFGRWLLDSGAHRIVVDTTTDGDGAGGERSARTSFAEAEPDWARTTHAHRLYDYLCGQVNETAEVEIGWSNAGFCGIAPRSQ